MADALAARTLAPRICWMSASGICLSEKSPWMVRRLEMVASVSFVVTEDEAGAASRPVPSAAPPRRKRRRDLLMVSPSSPPQAADAVSRAW